jgi:putative hemolysin
VFIKLMPENSYLDDVPFSSLPSHRLPGPLASAVNRLLQIDKLEQLYLEARSEGLLCCDLIRTLEIEVQVTPEDLKKIPVSGPVIAVSNHPFGILDGVLLAAVLSGVRSDVRVLTSRMLGDLPELSRMGIFIDPFERPESRMANGRALKEAIRHVKEGGMLLVFPAGEVAHFDFRTGSIRDPEWRSTAARLVRITHARTLPILVRGANSIPFQMLGMVHPRLRTAALPAEFLNKRGKSVEVRIGAVIEPAQMDSFPSDESALRYLRLRTELLARRGEPIHDRSPRTPEVPVAEERSSSEISREIENLPSACLLQEAREMAVYIADSSQIPLTLQEIGRLRELTFRDAGEGTGEQRDLDRFDPYYQHLFVWNREKREIVGAYRIGDIPLLLARHGRRGLYTNSLFRFSNGFLERLGPSLELGRSFIRPEYQRQFAPLLLLWKGISAYVWRRPEYATLIGAVSVSNRYSQASRELIARYFEKESWADRGVVKARHPLRGGFLQKWEMQALCSLLPAVDDLSAPIADLEPDGKGIPILVKQYVRLGGKLLAFSVDPHFGNTLDGFVVVDLRLTSPEILSRYMGKANAREFFAWHASSHHLVA